jgi:uncharacterized damage-inducible protein DinB
MITKENLVKLFKREFATTLKVIRAFPEDKLTFAPHERSSTARNVIRTFVFEMYLIESYVLGENVDRSRFQTYAPDKLATLIGDFEKETAHVISSLDKLPESDLNKTVEFAGKKMAADEFMLMMLFDQIHHRGQVTVYIRLAGGKVPSVYGPSADDKGTNL